MMRLDGRFLGLEIESLKLGGLHFLGQGIAPSIACTARPGTISWLCKAARALGRSRGSVRGGGPDRQGEGAIYPRRRIRNVSTRNRDPETLISELEDGQISESFTLPANIAKKNMSWTTSRALAEKIRSRETFPRWMARSSEPRINHNYE